MIARSLATPRLCHRVVGVITSAAELDFAIRMREPPDFFELRLDRLVRPPSRGSGAAGVMELRSAPAFRSLLRLARKQNVRCIVSVHYLKSTPSRNQLRDKARAAKTYGADIFKVATRTDTPAQLTRLIDFAAAKDVDIAVSAMGMGKLGAASRVLLVCCGSALVYVSLGRSNIEGQISLEQLRAFGMAPPR